MSTRKYVLICTDKIKTLTEGKSLEANIKLVLNNAKLGAEVAKELCKESAND